MLRKTEYSGIFHNGSVTLPPAGSTLGFFSNIRFLEELGPPNDWASLEFLSLRLAHIEPPRVCQLQFRFSYPSFGFYGPGLVWSLNYISRIHFLAVSPGLRFHVVNPSNFKLISISEPITGDQKSKVYTLD